MITKKTFFFAIIFLFLLLIGIITYQFLIVNKKHSSTSKVEISIQSTKLVEAFIHNETKADDLYINKLIQVTGVIKEINFLNDKTTLILEGNNSNNSGIICDIHKSQTKKLTNIKKHQKVTLKGICKGFLKDVILLDCYIDFKINE
ncbi:hypothetical protein DS884_08240 [Tenacibaculum sp. E3R01]|uniref:OB-fold protein n=1 Tax=Tenacibaculum sp. E3R01 TaxID=2267227 RepID=UPI000DEB1EA9|nr:hypothetical protein [Tenacibaculum sp. E3R01]RBW59715.1 hypothetical protein DS884_08240 [Tenacibaculum sp. E3R01]